MDDTPVSFFIYSVFVTTQVTELHGGTTEIHGGKFLKLQKTLCVSVHSLCNLSNVFFIKKGP